jgi:hypothetical protein
MFAKKQELTALHHTAASRLVFYSPELILNRKPVIISLKGGFVDDRELKG